MMMQSIPFRPTVWTADRKDAEGWYRPSPARNTAHETEPAPTMQVLYFASGSL
jgi:hypothetical protein